MKIGVCIRAKDEQKLICEFVAHYMNLGFDKIFIYDNMSDPSIEKTLYDKNPNLPRQVEIKIDNVKHGNQRSIYTDCINNNKDFDWILLCDADEFLDIRTNSTIKNFLSKYSNDVCTILINWVCYGTGGIKKFNYNKLVMEQFVKRESYRHFWNRFVKSFVRPKLMNKVTNIHIATNIEKYKLNNIYDVYGKRITGLNINKIGSHNIDRKLNDNTPLVLVHYMTLDYESMLQKHVKNTNGGLLPKNNIKYSLRWYEKFGVQSFKDNVDDKRMLRYCKKNRGMISSPIIQ